MPLNGNNTIFYTRLKNIKQEGVYFGALFIDFVWDNIISRGRSISASIDTKSSYFKATSENGLLIEGDSGM